MNYHKFDLEDFVKDEYFITWVKSPDEASNAFWEKWMLVNPEKEGMIAEAKAIVLTIKFNIPIPAEKQLNTILDNIHAEISKTEQVTELKRLNLVWMRRIAAAVIVGFGFWLGLNYAYSNPESYLTEFSETEKIELPDGSEVILNANSSIRVSPVWNKTKNREVWLTGEAFFFVSSEPLKGGKKFVVHAGEIDVEVLGTAFNVNNRNEEVSIVLESGKVNLQAAKAENGAQNVLIMNPGERVLYNTEKNFDKKVVDTKIYTSWIDNKLILEGTTLDYLIKILEDTHGYKVEVENEDLLLESLSGSSLPNDPEILLKGIEVALQLKMKKEGKNVFIEK